MRQLPFVPLARLGGSRLLLECLVMLEQMIDDPGDLVRRRHDGLRRSQPRPHRAKRGTEGRVGPCHRQGGLAKRLRGAVDNVPCPRAEPSPAGDVVGRASPGHEQQCFTVGNLLIAVPISTRRVCAMDAEMPVTALRSTPVRRAREGRAWSLG